MQLTRRGLLIGAAAGGGLLAAFSFVPRRYANPFPADIAAGEHGFNAWLKIARNGVVTVAIPACEMGQGIATVLAQVVAVELGADWKLVAIAPAPVSPAYADPVLAAHWASLWAPGWLAGMAQTPDSALARLHAERDRMMVTADGSALAAFEDRARAAAAAARAMLAKAAAARWDVHWEECAAQDGHIVHEKKRLRFAELVDDAALITPPDPPVLRPEPAREKPALFSDGAPPRYPRLDLPAMVDGGLTFAADVRLPGMVYAAIRHGPLGNSVLGEFDKAAAAGIAGLVGVVKSRRWLAAVASNSFAAEKALKAMAPRFRVAGPLADTNVIEDQLDKAIRRGGLVRLYADGDVDGLMAKPTLASRYDIDAAVHAPLETASATARLRDGKLELWMATQAPEQARRAAARAAGMGVGDVILYPMHAGGSFDARLDTRIAGEVAVIAKRIGKPVQLTWSRWQEALAGFPRTPVAALLSAVTTPDRKQVLGWKARLALPPTAIEAGARLLDGTGALKALETSGVQADPHACEGARPPYTVPVMAVDHVPVALALPTARYRGNAHGYTAFFNESFVDELAHFARAEPLSFRIGMLGGDARLVACLSGVAKLATWGGGVDASGQGIACHRIDLGERSGRIAVVATARNEEGAVKVDKLSAFVDIGRIVNMDIARQQIEGGMVFGLAMAIGGATGYERGLPLAGRLSELGLPLLADCPTIEIAFADSTEPPFDPGELGVVAVAPAIANALFSATGLRFRRLPLLSEGL
ncbi:molybdopterin cofactor-binding domain-containing protein [Novosphingobium lentum]|uniref:molybdopterin cofactor-binding domain-containing protein n=1 Tax=Novosphingobium lentum TaxID=145287 RepID=UPI0008340437|nr:molybdopterin cofactor-binding domain-containing protein [Novosphingobium lentum]